jgi:hypothetical protein
MKKLWRSLFPVFNAMFASSHRIENRTAKKWLRHYLASGSHTLLESSSLLVRKNGEILKI